MAASTMTFRRMCPVFETITSERDPHLDSAFFMVIFEGPIRPEFRWLEGVEAKTVSGASVTPF